MNTLLERSIFFYYDIWYTIFQNIGFIKRYIDKYWKFGKGLVCLFFLYLFCYLFKVFTMTKTRKRSRSIEEDDANVDVNGQISQSVDEIQSTSLNTSTELLKENIKRRPSATKADTKLKQIYNVQKVKKAFDFAKTV